MNHIRRIPHLAHFLAALACAMLGLAVSAPAAFAMRVPAPGGSPGVTPTGPGLTLTHGHHHDREHHDRRHDRHRRGACEGCTPDWDRASHLINNLAREGER